MTHLQRRSFAFELDAAETKPDQRIIAGYASAFGVIDTYGERVMPGAFTESIKRHKQGERPVRVLWQHDWDQPIGRPTLMQEDGRGLYTISQLADTAKVRDEIMPLLREKVVDRMSIGFIPITTTWNEDEKLLDLDVVDLWEYSPVTFPANDAAQITEAKSLRQKALQAMGLPAVGDELGAEQAQYAMAVLMGARGASDFADLPSGERAQLYARLERIYRQHGLEPPGFVATPCYDRVEFRHDERAIFLGRYLVKRIADVTSGAKGLVKMGRPVPAHVKDELREALSLLEAETASTASPELAFRRRRAEAILRLS